jgi:hypothetical protein
MNHPAATNHLLRTHQLRPLRQRQNLLIKLQCISSHHSSCNIHVKCEYFNAGGSVKDRKASEWSKTLKNPAATTQAIPGNTGIGIACIIVLPEKMSKGKVDGGGVGCSRFAYFDCKAVTDGDTE